MVIGYDADITSGFELDPSSDKVRCIECYEAMPSRCDFIARKSVKKHLSDSSDHKVNVATNNRRRSQAVQHQVILEASYAQMAYVEPNAAIPDPRPSARPDLYDDIPDLVDVLDDDNEDVYFDNPVIPADISPLSRDPYTEQQRLRQEVELLMMNAEHIDEFGTREDDDDATITNILNEFGSLGKHPLYITCLF